MCNECLRNTECRLCSLKLTIFDHANLLQMSEEDLIELAEIYHVTITPGKLLKSEIVRIILNTCKGPTISNKPPSTSNDCIASAYDYTVRKVHFGHSLL